MQFRLDFLIQWPEHKELTKTMLLVSRQNLDSELATLILLILLRKKISWKRICAKAKFMPLPNHPNSPEKSLGLPIQKQLCLNSN